MNYRLSTRKIAGLVVLVLTLFVVGVLSVSAPVEAASSAQGRETPTYTPTSTPEATEVPTNTPEPTATPTDEFDPATPTATNTPESPTEEPQDPTATPTPPTDGDDDGDGNGNDGDSSDDAVDGDSADCLARVEGFVLNAAGVGIGGATVTLSGTGWSTTWQTDSNGFFYFEGVCAGTVTLSSTINGQPVARNVRVTGAANSVAEATLRPGDQPQVQPATPTTASSADQQPAPQPTATPQVVQRLPQTGTTTSRFLLMALLLAGIMIGVRMIRARVAGSG